MRRMNLEDFKRLGSKMDYEEDLDSVLPVVEGTMPRLRKRRANSRSATRGS